MRGYNERSMMRLLHMRRWHSRRKVLRPRRLVWLSILVLLRIPLLLIVLILWHHWPHRLVVMLVPRMRTHVRPTVGHIMPPLMRWHGHLPRPIGHVRVHGVAVQVGRCLL